MKKIFFTIFLFSTLIIVGLFNQNITKFVVQNFIYNREYQLLDYNEYYIKNDYKFIQITDNFNPKNKQDIMNVIYTGLNSGNSEFTFYCIEEEYKNCIDDVKSITSDEIKLSAINNYIHPFNSFSKLNIEINGLGKIVIKVNKLYTTEEIVSLTKKVNSIMDELELFKLSDKDKIKSIHDYIINNTIYDQARANDLQNPNASIYHSNKAVGPLLEGYAICGGYTDAMALFLTKLGFDNYKISSQGHIWNYVLIDNTWVHLDLTWDDPVVDTGENVLLHSFFLISDEELTIKDTKEHIFNKEIYLQ